MFPQILWLTRCKSNQSRVCRQTHLTESKSNPPVSALFLCFAGVLLVGRCPSYPGAVSLNIVCELSFPSFGWSDTQFWWCFPQLVSESRSFFSVPQSQEPPPVSRIHEDPHGSSRHLPLHPISQTITRLIFYIKMMIPPVTLFRALGHIRGCDDDSLPGFCNLCIRAKC